MPYRMWLAGFIVGLIHLPGQPASGQSASSGECRSQGVAARDRKKEEPRSFRHFPADANGWCVTESRNFRIWHRGSRSRAEKVARAAEQARSAGFLRWFGEVRPSWQPRCEICLYPSAAAFHGATGVPEPVPGASTTRCEAGRVVVRRIDLRNDAEHLLDSILPHEVAHIVLADHFGSNLAPWANEGIAVQVEPRDRIQLHYRHLPHYQRQNQLFTVRRLVGFGGYPGSSQMGPFYAQSASLVEFLTREKDAPTFVRFLRDARANGHEKAMRRHYGWGLDECNRRWLNYAFSEEAIASR